MNTIRFVFTIITALLVVFLSNVNAQCDTNYPNSVGTTGVQLASLWTQLAKGVDAPDGEGIEILSVTPLTPGKQSSYIGLWDYGFAIPCNAIIDKVSLNVTRRNNAATGNVQDLEVQLKFSDFSVSTVNAASSSDWLNSTTNWETVTYDPVGGWGSVITPDMINSHLFGLVFTTINNGTVDGMPEVDAVEIEVCYTVNGTPNQAIIADFTSTIDDLCVATGNGSLTINASGGTGMFEYSIDGGTTWSPNNMFSNLSSGNYDIIVRDTDMSCTADLGPFYVGCEPNKILQIGDAIYSCRPTPSDQVTLAIDRVQPLHDYYQAGQVGVDVSDQLQSKVYEWTSSDLGGVVFSVTFDNDLNIYTGVSSLYQIISPVPSADLIRIDGVTGTPMTIATLTGTAGIGGVEYYSDCDQLFVSNLDDGKIYIYDTSGNLTGTTFDPGAPDAGGNGLAPIGERIPSLAYNPVEGRLYYSVWANDKINNGSRNEIWSIAVDPLTCDFVANSEQLEVSVPLISELSSTNNSGYSHPVLDIEFDMTGTIMMLGESGFNSTVPIVISHEARLLRYDGSSSNWSLVNVPTGANTDLQYEIGTTNNGTNSLGGVDFAYAGIDGGGCTIDEGSFLAVTGDALLGVDCTFGGCLYGLQYIPLAGGDADNSVLVDFARDAGSQQKGFFGDLDIVTGCCPCACPQLVYEIDPASATVCSGESITFCVPTVAGGTGPYTYSWSTGETTNCITVSPMMMSMYSVVVTDAEGCMTTRSAFANVAAALDLTITSANPNCNNANDGSAMVTVNTGMAPFTYQWDNDGVADMDDTDSIMDLGPGTYNVTVTDANNCTGMTTVVLTTPSTMMVSIATEPNTSCSGGTGSITATVTGGTPPYQYSLDGGVTVVSSNMFSNLMEGTFMMTIIDGNSCQIVESNISVGGPSALSFTTEVEDVTSCTTDNGSVTITVTGGTAPYMYSSNGGLDYGTSNIITGLAAGMYDIVVNDANDCPMMSSIIVGSPSAVEFTLVALDDMDCDIPNGSINITATSGVAPFSYSIDGGMTYSPMALFGGLGEGMYQVMVMDANGCVSAREDVLFVGPDCVFDGAIGNFVWVDTNGNGIQDMGEVPIEGVITKLFTPGGFLVSVAVSDAQGNYLHENVTPGDYYLEYEFPDNYSVTVANGSGNNNNDSDVNNSNGDNTTSVFTLGSGEIDLSWDLGLFECIHISGTAWLDNNLNDIEDVNENGINGLNVVLYQRVGNVWIQVADTYTGHRPGSTSDDGYYSFCVAPGEYHLDFEAPQNSLVQVRANVGNNDNIDSDVTNAFGTGTTDSFTVFSGDTKEFCGAGYHRSGTIGDTVWFDENIDGIRSPTEPGIAAVVVMAHNADGDMISATTTDANGNYILDNLPRNMYYLEFDLPNGYVATKSNIGTDEAVDSDIDNSFGLNTTSMVFVESMQHVQNVDAGAHAEGLPVTWLDIFVEELFGYNRVEWSVAAQVNVSHYELEYSHALPNNFTAVGNLRPEDPNSQQKEVFILDHNDFEYGINYYRVKQFDLDGRYSYSKIVSIKNEFTTKSILNDVKVYPNPVRSELNLDVDYFSPTENMNVSIFDLQGRRVADNIISDRDVKTGNKNYKVDVSNYAEGVYSLEIKMDNQIQNLKLIITK